LKYFNDWVVTTVTEEATYNPTDPNSIVKEWKNGHSYLSIAENCIRMTQGRVVAGHLMWGYEGPPEHQILPNYLINANNEQLLQYGLNHLEMVMRHLYTKFPNKKYDWTVVAEATRPTLFRRKLGLNLDNPDRSFVIQAYRHAQNVMNKFGRQRNNNADRLAYSDFITGINDPHIPQIIDILKALKQEGLIDAFYLQIRYGPNLNPNRPLTAEELSGLIDRISGETGVPVMITELDFKNANQTSVTTGFVEAAKACRDNPMCLGIQFDKVRPDNPNENELFSFENGVDARPDADYYAVLSAMIGL
jgi:GH35 family endo-1,4-beta-xylanase